MGTPSVFSISIVFTRVKGLFVYQLVCVMGVGDV